MTASTATTTTNAIGPTSAALSNSDWLISRSNRPAPNTRHARSRSVARSRNATCAVVMFSLNPSGSSSDPPSVRYIKNMLCALALVDPGS